MFVTYKPFCLFLFVLLTIGILVDKSFALDQEKAPTPAFITPSGDYNFLSKLYYQGKSIKNQPKHIVVLKFMSINCPPCKKELPSFLETALWADEIAKTNSCAIKFFVVNVDPLSKKKKILDYMHKMDVDIQNQLLLDPYGRGAKLFNVKTIPRTFIINKEGFITTDISIFTEKSYFDFRAKLQSLIVKTNLK